MDVCDEPKQMVPIRRQILDLIEETAERTGERPEILIEAALLGFCTDHAFVPTGKRWWMPLRFITGLDVVVERTAKRPMRVDLKWLAWSLAKHRGIKLGSYKQGD